MREICRLWTIDQLRLPRDPFHALLTSILNTGITWNMTAASPVSFKNLEVGYGSAPILHGISATIQAGSCVAITGGNGSGKSTLLKALLGLIPHQSGEIRLFGELLPSEPGPDPAVPWKKIGYVPQRNTIGGGVGSTVREVVETGLLGPRTWWLPRGSKSRVDNVLNQVGLSSRSSDIFQVLSGGQQQRTLIARALVRTPHLLLLDEPLTGLDRHNREVLARVIGEEKEAGHTSLIVLHELGELAPLIDRELHISAGHISHDGPHLPAGEDAHSDYHHEPIHRSSTPSWQLETQ